MDFLTNPIHEPAQNSDDNDGFWNNTHLALNPGFMTYCETQGKCYFSEP